MHIQQYLFIQIRAMIQFYNRRTEWGGPWSVNNESPCTMCVSMRLRYGKSKHFCAGNSLLLIRVVIERWLAKRRRARSRRYSCISVPTLINRALGPSTWIR